MNTKRWMLMGIILFLMVGCAQEPATVEQSATPIPDETTAPSLVPVRTGVTILADGVVQAAQPALPLAFETGGKLLAVHVQAGDLVREGDVLALLEEADSIDPYQAAVTSAEFSVLRAQQSRDNLYAHAALRQAEALLAISSAQQALDALTFDTPIRQSEALQAIAQAQEAVRIAQYRLNSLTAPATEATVTAAQSDVTLATQALERAEEAYAPYRNKPDDNLNKAYYGAAWAAAQQAYDAAVRYLNALKGSPSDLTRAQAEAELAVAQAQLAQAGATYDSLSGGIPPAELAVAEAQLAVAQAAYDSLENGIDPDELALVEAELANAQIQLTLAQNDLDDAIDAQDDISLVAPWTGTVLSVEAAPGALVGYGSPIVILLDTTQLEFHTINLSERDLAQIFPGQTAVVTLKTYPNEPIEAVVTRIGWQTGAGVGDAATFPVMLVLTETDLVIRPGMTGRAEIRSEE
jgi:multidrug resistance efflux pump